MSDFQITEHKYDDSDDSLDKFKKVFATEVDEALVEKFKQAEGVYIVQGRFGPRSIIDLHKGVEQGFWTKDKRWLPEQPYNGNYLIIIRPSPSSNPADCLVARPSASQGIYFVENGSITSPKGVHFVQGSTYRPLLDGYKTFSREHYRLPSRQPRGGGLERMRSVVGVRKGVGSAYHSLPGGNLPPGYSHFHQGIKGETLVSTPRKKDYFYCYGDNTYLFSAHWGKDTINYYNSGHKLVFYSNSPAIFQITKQGDDLKIQKDNKGSDILTITSFHSENFSFYSSTGIGSGTKQKYNLIENGEGQYKLALATK